MPKIVVDTNVVFEGITKQGGALGLVVEAWLGGLFRPCVSNALAYEYADVLVRKLSPARWDSSRVIFEEMLSLAEFTNIYFRWRPVSPDPGDDHVIDCCMNAGAALVTSNLKDFKLAQDALGLRVITPVDFIHDLLRSNL